MCVCIYEHEYSNYNRRYLREPLFSMRHCQSHNLITYQELMKLIIFMNLEVHNPRKLNYTMYSLLFTDILIVFTHIKKIANL